MRATGYVERKLWEWKKGAGKGRGLIDGETTRRRDDVFMIRKRGERKRYAGRLFVGQSLRSTIQRSGLEKLFRGRLFIPIWNVISYAHPTPMMFASCSFCLLFSSPLSFKKKIKEQERERERKKKRERERRRETKRGKTNVWGVCRK